MKQEEKRRRRKEMILQSAIEEFGTYGYEDASVNRICKRISISKGSVYYYFTNRDTVFIECIRWCYQSMITYTSAVESNPNDTIEQQFYTIFRARQNFFVTYPYAPVIMWNAMDNPPKHLRTQITQIRNTLRNYLTKQIEMVLRGSKIHQPEDMPLYLEVFLVASTYIHFNAIPDWDPTFSLEQRKELIDRNMVTFKKLIHSLLYGILDPS